MAGDWIKMRTDLYRDPKVCVIADILLDENSELSSYVSQHKQRDMSVTRNVMRNVTVGALVSVWGVLRHRGKRDRDDLVLRGCTVSVIDDIADIPGFGAALQQVGWAVESDNGIVFPNFFEEFNVDPEMEAKQKNAERQRRYREKHKEELAQKSNVTVTLKSNAREEKRREEVNTSCSIASNESKFAQFWKLYPRKQGKGAAEKAFLKAKLNGHFDDVIAALERQKQSEQWQRDGGQFIPNPATWLNQKRWEDEIPAADAKPFVPVNLL